MGPKLGREDSIRESLRVRLYAVRNIPRELRNWPEVLLKALGHYCFVRRGEFFLATRNGIRLMAPNTARAWWPLVEVCAVDQYRLKEITWSEPERTRTVFDIGAHVGSFTCVLARLLPGARFICVEPSPVAVGWLRQNVDANGIADRVQIVEAAISATAGSVAFNTDIDASCVARVVESRETGSVRVRSLTLRTLIEEVGCRPDIVKLDCEGGEYPAILGGDVGDWKSVEEVFLEYHPSTGAGYAELKARLQAYHLEPEWESLYQGGRGHARYIQCEEWKFG